MHRSIVEGSVFVVLMMALAGCSGEFDVEQTEPFRVQIDEESDTMSVREGEDAQEVDISVADCDCEEVDVEVQVKAIEGPCTIHVVIEDADGNELASRDITIEGTNVSMDGNETGNETEPPSGDADAGDTVTEIIQVNVKGKDNIVVINEATTGDAEVNIVARGGTGMQDSEGNMTTNETSPP